MRTCLPVALGLVSVVSGAPAAIAQNAEVEIQGSSTENWGDGDERQPRSFDGRTVKSGEYGGVFVEPPIGKVRVGAEFVEGDVVYARRTTATAGILVVEVSASPFMFDLPSNQQHAEVRPDQPAPW